LDIRSVTYCSPKPQNPVTQINNEGAQIDHSNALPMLTYSGGI